MSMSYAIHARPWWRSAVIVAVLSLAFFQPAFASSVVPMTVEQMADYAGQVVQAEVVSVRSYWAENPKRIESEVTFEKTEYLKGALPDSTETFRLIVPGGTVGETQMRLCCAPTFSKGERWILFVLPTYKTFPVVGLYQGAFRIVKDETGVDRIQGVGRSALLRIDDAGFVQMASKHVCPAEKRLVSQNGVRINASHPADASTDKAMTCEDFLDQLRPILAASKRHKLSAPAGQRVLVNYRSVPLRLADPNKTEASTKIIRHDEDAVQKADKTERPKAGVHQNTDVDQDGTSANTNAGDTGSSTNAAQSSANANSSSDSLEVQP